MCRNFTTKYQIQSFLWCDAIFDAVPVFPYLPKLELGAKTNNTDFTSAEYYVNKYCRLVANVTSISKKTFR